MGSGPADWRVIFAGTPEFATSSLVAMLTAGIRPVAVYTQPDRPAGRGRRPQPSAVKSTALAHDLVVEQPETLRDASSINKLRAFRPDIIVVVAYGQILNKEVLAIPALGCINVHASILPRWRGAAPIQRALLAGDAETGVSIMRMEAGLDTGPVYRTVRTPVSNEDTAGALHDRLALLGAEALVTTLHDIATRDPAPVPQAAEGVTWAHKLTKEEAWLDWRKPAEVLARTVRAFDPWPVAQTRFAGEVLRIWAARAQSASHDCAPGTIIEAGPAGVTVATGDGALELHEVQRPGGKRIRAADFANQRVLEGCLFE